MTLIMFYNVKNHFDLATGSLMMLIITGAVLKRCTTVYEYLKIKTNIFYYSRHMFICI